MIGAIEAIDILMGHEQHQASGVVVYLLTELKPSHRTLKSKREFESLPDDSENVYCETRLQKYLQRLAQLSIFTFSGGGIWPALHSSRKPLMLLLKGVHTVLPIMIQMIL